MTKQRKNYRKLISRVFASQKTYQDFAKQSDDPIFTIACFLVFWIHFDNVHILGEVNTLSVSFLLGPKQSYLLQSAIKNI